MLTIEDILIGRVNPVPRRQLTTDKWSDVAGEIQSFVKLPQSGF